MFSSAFLRSTKSGANSFLVLGILHFPRPLVCVPSYVLRVYDSDKADTERLKYVSAPRRNETTYLQHTVLYITRVTRGDEHQIIFIMINVVFFDLISYWLFLLWLR